MITSDDKKEDAISEVYCDSRRTLKRLLTSYPSSEGLYSHELAMLVYVSYGNFTTKECHYSRVFESIYGVVFPDALLFSLVSRGYVRVCEKSELLEHMKIDVLRRILKTKSIKPGQTKEGAIQKVRDNFTEDEYVELCGFYYYILSEKGKQVLANQPEGFNFTLDETKPLLKRNQIQLRTNSNYELYFSSQGNSFEVYTKNEHVKLKFDQKNWFIDEVSIEIYIDNNLTYCFERINFLALLTTQASIIVGRVDNSKKNLESEDIEFSGYPRWFENQVFFSQKYIQCEQYDLKSKKLTIQETILWKEIENSERIDTGTYNYNSCSEDEIHFVFSTCNAMADVVVSKYFSRFIPVKVLPALVLDETRNTYEVILSRCDIKIILLFLFMINEKAITDPSIQGCPTDILSRYLSFKKDSKILRSLVDDYYQRDYETKDIADRLLQLYSNSKDDLLEAIKRISPSDKPFVTTIGFRNVLGRNLYMGKNINTYVREHSNSIYSEFSSILHALMEEGVIKSRWINEFSLFHLIKLSFPNAEYQKRFHWLGMQSLDMFIPECSTAIEYQGQQHYLPIDFFGGQDAFEQTKQRDLKKKELCKENGIRLLEWDSAIKVTKKNVDKFIEENNLKIEKK